MSLWRTCLLISEQTSEKSENRRIPGVDFKMFQWLHNVDYSALQTSCFILGQEQINPQSSWLYICTRNMSRQIDVMNMSLREQDRQLSKIQTSKDDAFHQ